MTEMYPISNLKWALLKDVAEAAGLTPSAIRQAFNNHPEIKKLHYKVMPKGTGRGCDAWTTREGVALLKFRKPIFKGNQHSEVSKEGAPTSKDLIGAQDKTALMMAEVMKDPIVAMRMSQLRMEKRLDAIEEKLHVTGRLLEDTTPLDLTSSQRQFLNERVRSLAMQMNRHFSLVWGWVHDQVGKRHVEDYVFEDYAVAIKYLKQTYRLQGLEW